MVPTIPVLDVWPADRNSREEHTGSVSALSLSFFLKENFRLYLNHPNYLNHRYLLSSVLLLLLMSVMNLFIRILFLISSIIIILYRIIYLELDKFIDRFFY